MCTLKGWQRWMAEKGASWKGVRGEAEAAEAAAAAKSSRQAARRRPAAAADARFPWWEGMCR